MKHLALPLFALVAALTLALSSAASGQGGPELAIDADVTGNIATELGATEDCASLDEGGTATIDIVVRGVTDLLAWEGRLAYDNDIIEISDADVDLFMGANEGSEVQSAAGALPDSDGLFQIGAFDSSDPPTPDSGSGVLARITVTGVAAGATEVIFNSPDLDGDTVLDDGVVMRDAADGYIGDGDGDSFFDGDIPGILLSVGTPCDEIPEATATPANGDGNGGANRDDDDDGSNTWIIIVVIVGAVIVVLGGVAAFVVRRRGSSA
jgi:hypothetical protein